MKKINLKIILSIIVMLFGTTVFAEDPFSRSFSAPTSNSGEISMSSSGSSGSQDDGIHPMMRHDVNKYYIKGVIISKNGSLAIVSLPGDKDYFLFLGDPLGNDLHIIKEINQDFVILSKSDGEEIFPDVSITVVNPIQNSGLGG